MVSRRTVILAGFGLAAGVATSLALGPLGLPRNSAGNRPTKEFNVVVQTFEAGNFKPSTITVSKGDRVVVNFGSVDTTHGVAIDEFGVNTGPIPAGETRRVEFSADKVGSFRFYCNIFCSAQHLRQVGTLIVQ